MAFHQNYNNQRHLTQPQSPQQPPSTTAAAVGGYQQRMFSATRIPGHPNTNQGMSNGYIPNRPTPQFFKQPARMNPNIGHLQNAAVSSNLHAKTSPGYTPTNQNVGNGPGINGNNVPVGMATNVRPQQPIISSAGPTLVSSNMSTVRHPSAANPLDFSPQTSVNQDRSNHPSYQSGKRRPYPKQVAPSVPTSQPTHSQQHTNGPQQPSTNAMYNQYQQNVSSSVTNQHQQTGQVNQLMGRLSVEQSPTYPVNLLEQKQVVLPQPLIPPVPPMSQDALKKNANPQILRCSLNAIPQTSSLLSKCKLPFGIYVQPFKENMDIPIITSVITRCRGCRSYLNPFASILDHRKWQCNMCFRINELPEELSYDYSTRQYMDVRKRPELMSSSIEFIAPSEYMLRPPQPSVFVFVLDVSFSAISTGYLYHTCQTIAQNLEKLPGDSRTMIGFITFNSSVHFYSIKASQNQPQMFVMPELEDVYLPVPDGLLVNLKENKDMILQLLESLPLSFQSVQDTHSATGAAVLSARKLVTSSGGRITIFQTCLPSVGPGRLVHRETNNMTGNSNDAQNLNPVTDFYKKLSLDCAGEQIAVDLFFLAGQYCDIASLSGISRYSSGAVHFYPKFHVQDNPGQLQKFCYDFKRYLTRPIGFEAVMRLRCSKGLSIQAFHGNFFVRSTDLLSLPNVNPDHSFSMQMAIEESLTDSNLVSFQAALLYTTTKGERRIRVHTLALPVTSKLSDVYAYADQEAIISSISKLAVDRTLGSSLGDAREALMNACIDCLKVYRSEVANQRSSRAVLAPFNLRLFPLYVLALMKSDAFKLGSGVTLDSRVFGLLEYKWQPWNDMMLKIYPRLYSILDLLEEDRSSQNLPILQASAEKLSRQGIYLMDTGKVLYLFVGRNVPEQAIQELFGVSDYNALPEQMNSLPELQTPLNSEARKFILKLRSDRPFFATLEVIREDTRNRLLFLNKLIDDRTESSMSYHEFLQHIQRQLNG